jgi:hypothetical protein
MMEHDFQSNDKMIKIDLEEYVFGHKGGMGEIAKTPSLSARDLTFLYDTIEIYQGQVVWQNDDYGLTCCCLPSKKIAITAVFPDADQGGRSTILGDCLIISRSDFEKLNYNPFFLFEKKLFCREKNRSPHIENREFSCLEKEIIDSFNKLGCGIKDNPCFCEILDIILNNKRLYFCTGLPANTLVKNILYALPTSARSDFTFSTMEPGIREIELSGHPVKQIKRNIVFTAIPERFEPQAKNITKASAYFFKKDRLTPIGKARIYEKSSYSKLILKLVQKGQELYDVYKRVEQDIGFNISQTIYVDYINYRYFQEQKIHPDTLYSLQKLVSSHKFVEICISALQKSELDKYFFNIHSIMGKNLNEYNIDDVWPKLNEAYKTAIKRSPGFIEDLLSFLTVQDGLFLDKFKKDTLPLICETISHQINNNRETAFPYFLFSYPWIYESPVKKLLYSFLISSSDALSQITIDFICRTMEFQCFKHFFATTQVPTNHAVFKILEQLNDYHFKETFLDKSLFLFKIFWEPMAGSDHIQDNFENIIVSILKNGTHYQKNELLQFLQQAKTSYDLKDKILDILGNQHSNRLKNAILLTRYFGFEPGFSILKNHKHLLNGRKCVDFFEYLHLIKDLSARYYNENFDFWVKTNKDNSYADDFTFDQKQLLNFFISERGVFSFPHGNSSDYQQNHLRSSYLNQRHKEKRQNWILSGLKCVSIAMIISILIITGFIVFTREEVPNPFNDTSLGLSNRDQYISLTITPKKFDEELPGLKITLINPFLEYYDGIRLTPGEYTAKIEADGHQTAIHPFKLELGNPEKAILYSLEKKIQPVTYPKVTFFIDIKPDNIPGIQKKLMSIRERYYDGIQLDSNQKYKIHISAPEYKPFDEFIYIDDTKEEFWLTVNLIKKIPASNQSPQKMDKPNIKIPVSTKPILTPNISIEEHWPDDVPDNNFNSSQATQPDKTDIFLDYRKETAVPESPKESEKQEKKSDDPIKPQTKNELKHKLIIQSSFDPQKSIEFNKNNMDLDRTILLDLFKKGFKNNENISVSLKNENSDDVIKIARFPLVFGEIYMEQQVYAIKLWETSPSIGFTYASLFPPEKIFLKIDRQQYPVTLPLKKINLEKFIFAFRNKSLGTQEYRFQGKISAMKHRGGILEELFSSNIFTIRFVQKPLMFYKGNTYLFTIPRRYNTSLHVEDYQELWNRGVRNRDNIKLKINGTDHPKQVIYGSAILNRKTISGGSVVTLDCSFETKLALKTLPQLYIQIGQEIEKKNIKTFNPATTTFSHTINCQKALSALEKGQEIMVTVHFSKATPDGQRPEIFSSNTIRIESSKKIN